MTIWDAYETYRIMPNLRLHQLRVAALARTLAIARHAAFEHVTVAALLHDMGNIMKSDFTQFPPDFYGDKDISYWHGVQDDCAKRFGSDEYTATAAIARDIGVSDDIVHLMGAMGFSKAEAIFNDGPLELQILEYADQRVAPYGIVSLDERLKEGHARYRSRARADYSDNDREFEKNSALLTRLEQTLFEGLLITPQMLSEASLKDTIEALRSYDIA